MRRLFASTHFAPLALLAAFSLFFWGRVLFFDQVLLPGEMLSGFAPFGSKPNAPWTILQWDSLAQYFPWRFYAAQELRSGHIPLWNPHQFAGTPFLANAQSAVFYPLNFPFWIFDTARAFGIAALLHSLLASFGTYFLLQNWRVSRASSIVGALGFAFGGYFMGWALLPTLFATAAWFPLCLLVLEKAAQAEKPARETTFLGICLACALLAGHAQIFFYLLLALALRAIFFGKNWRVWPILASAFVLCLGLSAPQILPTLELAKLGHRAGGAPSLEVWEKFWVPRTLQSGELVSLLVPNWPMSWGSLNENFGYIGTGVLILAIAGIVAIFRQKERKNSLFFGLTLAIFGLLYALATPLAKLFFFGVPGVSQMGGTGRALVLWTLGAALLAGFGLDFLRLKLKSAVMPLVFVLWIGAELFATSWLTIPTAPRATIYPQTELTTWLQNNTKTGERILFLTPPNGWLPNENLQQFGRNHPSGVLLPNGALVYGLNEVNGYDSLSPRAYRDFVQSGQKKGISPPLNGNMILLDSDNIKLDELGVRYRVSETNLSGFPAPIFQANGAFVYERKIYSVGNSLDSKSGRDFYPGWSEGQYQPQTFRFGCFVLLATIGFLSALAIQTIGKSASSLRRLTSSINSS